MHHDFSFQHRASKQVYFFAAKILPPGTGFNAPRPSNNLYAVCAHSGWIREKEQLALCSILIIAQDVDDFYFQRTQFSGWFDFTILLPFSTRLHTSEVFGGQVWLNHAGRKVKLTLKSSVSQLVQPVQGQHPQSNTVIGFVKCLEEAKLLQIFQCFRTNNLNLSILLIRLFRLMYLLKCCRGPGHVSFVKHRLPWGLVLVDHSGLLAPNVVLHRHLKPSLNNGHLKPLLVKWLLMPSSQCRLPRWL